MDAPIIREAARKRILFLPHAIRQMARPDRMIFPEEVRKVVFQGDIIEEYLADVRGPSVLLLGHAEGSRPIHVVCSPKDDYLAIITAYIPDPEQWSADLRTRRL